MKLHQALITATFILGSAARGFSDTILIDDFTDGSNFTDANTSGTATYNYLTGAADIIGGSRQVRTRAAGSGYYGPSAIAVNAAAGTLSSYGGDVGDRYLEYGSAIGSVTFTGAGPGTPVNLNLDLNLGDAFDIGVSNASSGDSLGITLFDSLGDQFSTSINISAAGNYSVPFSDFTSLTQTEADDIDGFMFNPDSGASSAATGLVLNGLSISTVPEPSPLVLGGLGCAGGLFLIRRRKQPGYPPRGTR